MSKPFPTRPDPVSVSGGRDSGLSGGVVGRILKALAFWLIAFSTAIGIIAGSLAAAITTAVMVTVICGGMFGLVFLIFGTIEYIYSGDVRWWR